MIGTIVGIGIAVCFILYAARYSWRTALIKPCSFCDEGYRLWYTNGRKRTKKRAALRGSAMCTCNDDALCQDPACCFRA